MEIGKKKNLKMLEKTKHEHELSVVAILCAIFVLCVYFHSCAHVICF